MQFKRVVWGLLWTLVISLPAIGSDVSAQMTDFQRLKSKKWEAKARKFYGQGRFVEAANSFRAAFNARSDPRYIYNIGKCYQRLKDYLEAATFYSRYLELVPGAKDRKQIGELIRSLQFQAQGDWARLTVLTSPVGANVYLNSRKKGVVGITPMTRTLPPGRYTVIIERKGHYRALKTVIVLKKQRKRLNIILKPHLGFLKVNLSRKRAKMILDGVELARVPKNRLRLKTGTHYIFLERKNFRPVFKRIQIERNKTSDLKIDLQRLPLKISRSVYWPWAWVTMSVGIVSLATGVTFGLLSRADQQQANSFDKTGLNNSRDELDSIQDKARKKALVANIMFGIGAAAVVTGAILFILDWRDMKHREEKLYSGKMRLLPELSPAGVQLSWSVIF